MERDDSSVPSSLADLAALGMLFHEHRPKLLAMLRRRIDPALVVRADPEDILGEAFLMARRKWADFQRQSALSPYAWLYRIALDCLIEAWRRENRDCRDLHKDMPLPEESSVCLGLGLVQTGATPSQELAGREEQQRMRQALDLLKEADRKVLWMRHYDELSFRDVAQVLGITENAAAVRYTRALRRLKVLWQQLYGDRG